jgi:hypothetical protein
MSTYNRNENANRHTENVVHLAKHFGTKADQAQAKFFKDELKKHGHNIHHEAAYKLHEKLWPSAVAAHKVEKLEESEQLDELKIPKAGFVERGMIGFHPRSIAGRVHQMPHHELKSLHHAYEKNPPQSMTQKQQHRSIKTALRKFGDAQGTHNYVDKSKFVKKDLKEGLMSFVQRKIAGPIEKRHAEYNNEKKKLHKSQFVKNAAGPTRLPKAISEEAHSDTFNTVKTVIHEALRKNLRSQSDIDKFARRGRAAKNLLGLANRELTKLATKTAKEPKDTEKLDESKTKAPTRAHVTKLYRLDQINPKKYGKEYSKAYAAHADSEEKAADRMWSRGDKYLMGDKD